MQEHHNGVTGKYQVLEPTSGRPALRVGVLGAGYWGPNIVRNFLASARWKLHVVADISTANLQKIDNQFPGTPVTTNIDAVITDPEIDAIAIITPPDTHMDLALRAIANGKHILVEKPLASNASEARIICEAAEGKGVTVMVDHTFLYTGAVEYLRDTVAEGGIGRCVTIDSVRINLGAFRETTDVLYDLAPHDISIINFILGEEPTEVSAISVSAFDHFDQRAIGYLTLRYGSGVVAHAHLSWLSPVKIRRMILAGTENMILWDDVEPSEKIRVYNKGVEVTPNPASREKFLVSYRTGDVVVPTLDTTEALLKVVNGFYDAIVSRAPSRATGDDGLKVLEILEAAQESVASNGRFVPVRSSVLK